jgi:hypothetical protein
MGPSARLANATCANLAPHSRQNLLPRLFIDAQEGHAKSMGLPHCVQ